MNHEHILQWLAGQLAIKVRDNITTTIFYNNEFGVLAKRAIP